MAMQLKEVFANNVLKLQHYTWQRNVLCGAGIAYATANEKYWHLPVAWFMPSIYAGFQVYKGRDQVRAFVMGAKEN